MKDIQISLTLHILLYHYSLAVGSFGFYFNYFQGIQKSLFLVINKVRSVKLKKLNMQVQHCFH